MCPDDEPPTPSLGWGLTSPDGTDAETVREQVTNSRAALARQLSTARTDYENAMATLKAQQAQLEAEMARTRRALEAQLGPLRDQLAKVEEVSWTIDLFLGRGETIRQLRGGTPAPADTPVTVRQKVLSMAEESLVFMDYPGSVGMDAGSINAFIDWLVADDAHLDRVLPDQKGVVVLVPTRVQSRSGNAWQDAAMNEQNSQAYWLLRSGQRVSLMVTDPKLHVGDRLIPKRTEFSEVFGTDILGRPGHQPLQPGSQAWLQAEEIADARRRHYMRIMLVLSGLAQRTTVWHPLPEGGVNFLSIADQNSGKILLRNEIDDVLGDGRESFRQWQRRLNAQLRPGHRVIGDWYSTGFQRLRREGDRYTRGRHPRLHPPTSESRPDRDQPHLIEERRGSMLVIRYQRTDHVERRNVPIPDRPGWVYPVMYTEPVQRGSLMIDPADDWVLPYDLVTVEELEYYLNSRENREQHFLSMVPTVQAALAAKRAEASAEAPFRELLGRAICEAGADPDTVTGTVDELVHWWKTSKLYAKALNGDPDHEARAAQDILAEYRVRAANTDRDDTVVVSAGRRVPGVIAVARKRSGEWFAYSPSDSGPPFLTATRIFADGRVGAQATDKVVPVRSVATMQVAWSAPEWDMWPFAANPRHYLTRAEREALIEQARDRVEGEALCVVEFHDPAVPSHRWIAAYGWDAGPVDEAAIVADTDPLDFYAARNNPDYPVRSWVSTVVKDKDGARFTGTVPTDATKFKRHFGGFSGTYRGLRSLPWWPDDAYQYPDKRPRLVWANDPLIDQVAGWVKRCAMAEDVQRRRAAAAAQDAYAYSTPLVAIIRERAEAAAHQQFLQDFGSTAEDLWPAHLKSLQLPDPIHPRLLWGLVKIAQEHDHPVVGQTLAELSQFADSVGNRPQGEWHHQGTIDVAEFGDVVVPDPGAGAGCPDQPPTAHQRGASADGHGDSYHLSTVEP